ncbi:MAG: Mrp/NBP35 family ATP-binding protein [Deltaproteobacteria bacterium]|nr:Mrp/NBP35 family ATP-binding protein [Deltaproteobacteria bacterium]
MAGNGLSEVAVREALKGVVDPVVAQSIVEAGYVKSVAVSGARVRVAIELPTPAHAAKGALAEAIEGAVKRVAGVSGVDIDWSWDVVARGGPVAIGRAEGGAQPVHAGPQLGGAGAIAEPRMASVKNIIAVASGKGGVGKSTVAANLALALRSFGARVGLLDADIYGPSQPTMLGAVGVTPSVTEDKKMLPVEVYGVQMMSIGFFLGRANAVVWRGPMVGKMIQQFVEDTVWGRLDYVVVDLPPGTGDAQLSLTQLIPLAGAVMVTTPQEVALIDVLKAMDMFKKVNVPVLGIVENMSGFACPKCGHHEAIFNAGGGEQAARDEKVPFLGRVPLVTEIREGGDAGRPVTVTAPDSAAAKAFRDVACRVAGELAKANLAKRALPVLTIT